MGVKGPVPKRSDQRRRTNEPVVPIVKAEGAARVPVPKADTSWHPVALRWYRSLARSGQSRWYEPSDWAVAHLIAESMSRDLLPQVVGVLQDGRDAGQVVKESIPLKGASLSAYLRAFSVLLVTEGDRRRLQVELQRPESDPDDARVDATVTDLRSRLSGG
jgi:hypothetical protein